VSNVSVLSVDGESMIPNQTVVIDGGKITHILDKSEQIFDVKTIDGTGKYLIPGLIDSHAHVRFDNDLLVFIANGVTSIREMLGNQQHLDWKRDIEKGRVGPKMYVASEKIQSKPGVIGYFEPFFRRRINVNSEEQAFELIENLRDQGYQAAKVGSFINPEMFDSISRASKKYGINLVGHIPHSVKLEQIWSSNLKEFAHIEELTKALDNEFGGYNSNNAAEYLDYVRSRSQQVATTIKQQNIAIGSTLWIIESFPKQALELESFIKEADIKLAYAHPDYVEDWLPGENNFESDKESLKDPEFAARVKIFWDTYAEAVRIMLTALIKEEVKLLAATDSMNPLVIPGFSVHQELESLVMAGLSPSQAILSATKVPSELMQSKTGTVAIGYEADLVLLDNNPLVDIKHITSIDTVISSGRIFNKKQLKHILDSVKQAYE
jgi:hypothetical protein